MQRFGIPGSTVWGIEPFFIEHRPLASPAGPAFAFQAQTTSRNVLKVLRAMHLRKAILLEGSPGVGKTSLIAAMAKATGKILFDILSLQA